MSITCSLDLFVVCKRQESQILVCLCCINAARCNLQVRLVAPAVHLHRAVHLRGAVRQLYVFACTAASITTTTTSDTMLVWLAGFYLLLPPLPLPL